MPVSSSNNFSGNLLVTVECLNLSEMMSGNDELIMLIYLHQNSPPLSKPLLAKKFSFDTHHRMHQFDCSISKEFIERPLLLVLVEQDDEMPIEQIDSIMRLSYRSIEKEFAARNYAGIEEYLGDEDVLAIKSIPALFCSQPNRVHVEGFYKADKYEYLLKFECLKE